MSALLRGLAGRVADRAAAYHLPANGGDGELELEAVLTPGLDLADMFTDLYAALREHRGLAQFARMSIVFRRYTRTIHFKAPVRAAMSVVATTARLFGVRTPPAPSQLLARTTEAK
jgi:hypothetical protein